MNLNATILGQAIAFVLFVFFCMKYVWPPLMAVIEKRQKEIADGMDFVERAKQNLDIAKAEASQHLKQAKVEAQEIIEQANKQKIRIINETKAKVEEERNRIFAQTQAEIDAERKRVREELRQQVAMLALASAEKIIEHSIDSVTNSDIVDKVVAELSHWGMD